MNTSTALRAAAATFAECAAFYDALTGHHNYEGLVDTLEELIAAHGHPGRRLLDVACGTGKSAEPFARRGYLVTAADLSPEMLAVASRRLPRGVELVLADMRELPHLGSFDLVTCIDEPINYLLSEEEVADCFASVARNLGPGGLFLFDLNTIGAFRSIFARDECHEQDGWLFVWRGHGGTGDEEGMLSGFTIEAFREETPGHWTRLSNDHHQRHHQPAAVCALLDAAGMDVLAVHGMTPDGALHPAADEERHTKAFYLARKREE